MWNYNVCAVFLLDATFITDPSKFISGALLSLSAMVQLELPHLNVLTKCDLADRSEVITRMHVFHNANISVLVWFEEGGSGDINPETSRRSKPRKYCGLSPVPVSGKN